MSSIPPLQTEISEYLLLFHKLPRLRACHEQRARYVNNEHFILEVITSVFATGHPGELFAAAFDKQTHEVVLAKNGDPTEEDIAFAHRFFSFTTQPEVKSIVDLFSFLQQWRPGGLKKRIRKLYNAATNSRFCTYLDLKLQKLKPNEQVEFFSGEAFIKQNFEGKDPFFILKSCRDIITEQTPKVLDTPDMDLSTCSRVYAAIINAAIVVARCSLMPSSFELDLGQIEQDETRKMKGHARKASRYLSIDRVIRASKHWSSKEKPIHHRWAKNNFVGSGEGEIRLNATTAREVMRRTAIGLSYIPDRFLEKVLPAREERWPTSVHTSIHPEFRLIFDLGPVSTEAVHPIGLSKRSCLGCVAWVEAFNFKSPTRWVVSEETRQRPDETWAIPGDTHLVEGNKLAVRVKGCVRHLLTRKINEIISKEWDYYSEVDLIFRND